MQIELPETKTVTILGTNVYAFHVKNVPLKARKQGLKEIAIPGRGGMGCVSVWQCQRCNMKFADEESAQMHCGKFVSATKHSFIL